MNNSSGNNFQAKQEYDGTNNNSKLSRTTTPSSSRQWGGYKNPRIVRVSRAFGGKDRHSKVCTIRGLRDRRIRLSVPTAIQLYDLQDRLGLSQPSKVVDWLLEAAKHEVDLLPPLQIPPGYFNRFQHPPLFSQVSADDVQQSRSHFFNSNPPYMKDGASQALKEKSKIITIESGASGKNKSIADQDIGGYNIPQVSAQSFFPLGNSFYQWEPSNLSLAQFGHPQIEDSQNTLPLSLASSLSFPSGSQLYFNPTATPFQPIIPPYMANYTLENDPRAQLNHFHFLNSSSQQFLPNSVMPTLNLINPPMKTFGLNDDHKWIHSKDDDDGDDDDDEDDDDSQLHEDDAN